MTMDGSSSRAFNDSLDIRLIFLKEEFGISEHPQTPINTPEQSIKQTKNRLAILWVTF